MSSQVTSTAPNITTTGSVIRVRPASVSVSKNTTRVAHQSGSA
jgi:hypothetical protein